MAFELRLTITGLCMFVPDDSDDGPVLHVLMPKPCGEHDEHGHGLHAHEAHRAVLMYDRACHGPDWASVGGDRCVQVSLDGRAVSMRGKSPPKLPTLSSEHLPAMDPDVRPACVGVPLDRFVHSRVELRGLDRAESYSGRSYKQEGVLPIHHVRFVIGRYEDSVALGDVFHRIPGIDAPDLPSGRLSPPPGARAVDLRIAHVLEDVVGPICAGEESPNGPDSHHAAMYLCLAERGGGTDHTALMTNLIRSPSYVCSPARGRIAR